MYRLRRGLKFAVQFQQMPAWLANCHSLKGIAMDAYTAENYDRLADSPFEVGTFQETDFDESGAHYPR